MTIKELITEAIDELSVLLEKKDKMLKQGERPLIQYFGRICRVIDVVKCEIIVEELPSCFDKYKMGED